MGGKDTFSRAHKAILLLFLAALIGGGGSTFAKISLKEIPPLSFTLLRFLLSACVLLPFVIQKKELHFKNAKKAILISLLATLNTMLFMFGVERTSASVSTLLYAGVPLIAAVFAYVLWKEKIYGRKALGILIGFVGVLVIVLLPVLEQKTGLGADLSGNLIILVGVCSFALYSVLSKDLQKEHSPLQLTMFFVLASTAVQLVLVPFDFVQNKEWWSGLSGEAFFGLLYTGVLGTGVYYLIYQHAIKNTSPVVASLILYLQPIFAFLWASLLLGEKLTPEFIMGAALAFIGVAIVTNFGRKEVRKESIAKGKDSTATLPP